MGRKSRISYEDKIKACEDYLSGRASSGEIAHQLNLGTKGRETVRKWANKYRTGGPESLLLKLLCNDLLSSPMTKMFLM